MVWIIDKHHAGRLAHINCSDQYVAMALKTKTPQEAWDKCASGADLIYQLAYETHRGGVGLKSVVAVVTHCVRTALDSGAVAFFPEAELILQDVEAWLIGRRVDFKRTMRNLARDSTPHGDSDTIYRALFDLVPLAGRLEGWHVDDERVAEVAREALKEVATTMAWDMVEKRVVERGVPYDSPEYGPEHDDENNAWFEDELKISSATVAAWVRSQVPNPPKPPMRWLPPTPKERSRQMEASMWNVTITGADDDTNPWEMFVLSKRFPFLEWGILCSNKRTGTSRYPSTPWAMGLATAALGWSRESPMRLSVHLCGELSRSFMKGGTSWFGPRTRVQVNGFDPDLVEWMTARQGAEVILPCNLGNMDEVASFSREWKRNPTSLLFDVSGGRGVRPGSWPAPPPGVFMGYAGGISPDNVVETLESLGGVSPTWIDMESGVRTDGKLDMQKVEAVLRQVEEYNVRFQGKEIER